MAKTGSKFKVGSCHGELNTPLLKVLDPIEGEAGYRGLFKCQAEDCPNVFEARIALIRNNNTSSCGCKRYRPVPSAKKATASQARKAEEYRAAAPPPEKYVPKKIAPKGQGLSRAEKRAAAAGGAKKAAPAKKAPAKKAPAKKAAPAKRKAPAKKGPTTAQQLASLTKLKEQGKITEAQFKKKASAIIASDS